MIFSVVRSRFSGLPCHLYHRHHLQTDQDADGDLRQRRSSFSQVQIVHNIKRQDSERENTTQNTNDSFFKVFLFQFNNTKK